MEKDDLQALRDKRLDYFDKKQHEKQNKPEDIVVNLTHESEGQQDISETQSVIASSIQETEIQESSENIASPKPVVLEQLMNDSVPDTTSDELIALSLQQQEDIQADSNELNVVFEGMFQERDLGQVSQVSDDAQIHVSVQSVSPPKKKVHFSEKIQVQPISHVSVISDPKMQTKKNHPISGSFMISLLASPGVKAVSIIGLIATALFVAATALVSIPFSAPVTLGLAALSLFSSASLIAANQWALHKQLQDEGSRCVAENNI